MKTTVQSLFDAALAEVVYPQKTVSKQQADQLFELFKNHPLFNWADSNNGCEGRADAVCILLEAWDIPTYKGWVFSGAFLKKLTGALKQNWKYHVAAVLPVLEKEGVVHYIIDPATGNALQPIEQWAAAITHDPHSYFFTRQAHWYIFPSDVHKDEWHTRNKQNRKWMIQCLAGINSLTAAGKAALVFNKRRIQLAEKAFEKAKDPHPLPLSL